MVKFVVLSHGPMLNLMRSTIRQTQARNTPYSWPGERHLEVGMMLILTFVLSVDLHP